MNWRPVGEKPEKTCLILVGYHGCESQLAQFDLEDPDYLTVLVSGGWAENVPFTKFQAWALIPPYNKYDSRRRT